MPKHTLCYLDQQPTSSVELRCSWDEGSYTATVLAQPCEVVSTDLIRTLGPGEQALVAQKPAQGFRSDRFHRFTAEHLGRWQAGEYDHLLVDNETAGS